MTNSYFTSKTEQILQTKVLIFPDSSFSERYILNIAYYDEMEMKGEDIITKVHSTNIKDNRCAVDCLIVNT